MRCLRRAELSERHDPQQLRALHSNQQHGAAVLCSDGIDRAPRRSRLLRRPADRTRPCGYEALLYHLLQEVDLTGFNVRKVPQTEALREQRDQSLSPMEVWWCELLESGTLRGADPGSPNRAVSNSYTRIVEVETVSYGTTVSKQPRVFTQLGVFDQARQIEPRLRNYTSDHALGRFLKDKSCSNIRKVARRAGWTFPSLTECRAAWEVLYPGWVWRNPDLTEWQAEADEFKDFADLKHLDAEDVLDALNRKTAGEDE